MNKKEFTKKCTRGGAPLHELHVQSQLFRIKLSL